jgi:RimJ/RimL family protein N-acetyltransferase
MGVKLRKARDSKSDCLLFFEARNDPESRRASRNPDLISIDDHKNWYKKALIDPGKSLYVIEDDGQAVGYCRVEGQENEVSVALLPKFRGRGIGSKAIISLSDLFPGKRLKAVVKSDNIQSRKAFEKAGYRLAAKHDLWEVWEK